MKLYSLLCALLLSCGTMNAMSDDKIINQIKREKTIERHLYWGTMTAGTIFMSLTHYDPVAPFCVAGVAAIAREVYLRRQEQRHALLTAGMGYNGPRPQDIK